MLVEQQPSDEEARENEKQINAEKSASQHDVGLVIGHDAENRYGAQPVKAWSPARRFRVGGGVGRNFGLLRRHRSPVGSNVASILA